MIEAQKHLRNLSLVTNLSFPSVFALPFTVLKLWLWWKLEKNGYCGLVFMAETRENGGVEWCFRKCMRVLRVFGIDLSEF